MNRERRASGATDRMELAAIEKKIAAMIAVIEDGGYVRGMMDRLRELEARQDELTERLAEALRNPEDRDAAASAIRGLIERIVLNPGEKWGEVNAVLHGELGTILEWTGNEDGKNRTGTPASGMSVSAATGSRPRLPADQRYANAYLFGAICPMEAKGAALMLPFANTRAMQMHLGEISCNVAAKAHGVVLMDRAGWHCTDKLKVPKNLTIILLPSRSPELNPVENIWQYLRQNWLSNRVFEDYDAIIEAGCQAWNKLINQPETIMSIGSREWAHKGR